MELKSKYLFADKYTKTAILITVVFILSSTFVAVYYNPFLTSENAVYYYFPGTEILEGNGKNVVIPNAPFTTAVMFALTDDPYIHMRIISILSSAGIVILSYMITRQILGSRVAIITTMIIALYAGLHRHVYVIDPDVFPIFLLFVSFYFITKPELDSRKIVIISIFVGLSFIMKYQAGIIGIGFLIFFLIYTKPRFKNAVLFLIICFLTVSPLLIYNYVTLETVFTSNSSYLALMEWNNVPKEWYEDDSYNDSFLLVRDVNLLFQNFGNQLYNNVFYIILNFKLGWGWNNLSVFPMIPFIGMIPLFGGMYILRKSIPKNLMPFIIAFLVYFSAMSIFANAANPIRLFPPALIIPMFSAVFFAKINKKKILIPIIIFIIITNLGASTLMTNWLLFHNDTIYVWENKILWKQEVYDIGKILAQEEDIESKYVMSKSNLIAYHANSNFIRLDEPLLDEDVEKHITREDWNQWNIHTSNIYSHPQIKGNILEEKPDYLVIEPLKTIPENWSVMYQSEEYAIYKIPK